MPSRSPTRRSTFVLLAAALAACSGGPLLVGEMGPDAGHAADGGGAHDAPLVDATADGSNVIVVDAPPIALDALPPLAQYVCGQGTSWSWCNPQPTGVTLDAVWGSASDDVWAVGAGGVAEHWSGTGWTLIPTPTTLELFGVWGSAKDDVWAVGSDAHGSATVSATSVILHWTGTAWSVAETLSQSELWAIWGSGPGDIWAVGAADPGAALALHYTGGTAWAETPLPPASVLDGVSGSAVGDVWAVGSLVVQPDASTTPADVSYIPEIFHWTGASWLTVYDNNGGASPGGQRLSVWAFDMNDAWAGTYDGSPLHWNGTVWQPVPGEQPTAFGGTAETDVWGVMGSETVHWDGSMWNALPAASGLTSPGSEGLDLTSVWAASKSDAWAVGEGGALVYFDGIDWTSQSLMPEMFGTWASAPNDAWAVGANGTALHWNGAAWFPTTTGTTEPLAAVWGSDSDDVFAVVAPGSLLRWDGSAWSPFIGPNVVTGDGGSDPILAIGGTAANDIWVTNAPDNGGPAHTGDAGTSGPPTNAGAIYHWDGSSWSGVAVPLGGGSAAWLESIWANSTTDVWGVGYQTMPGMLSTSTAIVARYQGGGWSLIDTPMLGGDAVATEFAYVWGSGPGDVWVAGEANSTGGVTSAVLHWSGASWDEAAPANLTGVGGLWGSGQNDVWMWAHFDGTADESLVHWTGSAWSVDWTLPDAWSYGNAIGGSGQGDVWAVGSGGMILHHP